MTRYPLLFMYRDRLAVLDHLVEVTVRGRALAVHEDEGWWIYGVAPGGLAESGATDTEVQAAFRKSFSEILQDMAASVASLDDFRLEVRDFFTANDAREAEWWTAVEDVRANRVTSELERLPADTERGVEVRVIGEAPLGIDPQPLKMAA